MGKIIELYSGSAMTVGVGSGLRKRLMMQPTQVAPLPSAMAIRLITICVFTFKHLSAFVYRPKERQGRGGKRALSVGMAGLLSHIDFLLVALKCWLVHYARLLVIQIMY